MKKNYTLITLACMTIGYSMNSAAQTVTTLANAGNLYAIAAGKLDTLYVADQSTGFMIKKVTPAGTVSVLAGSGTYGSADGTGTAASMAYVYDMESDAAGNIYFSDWGGSLRMVTPAGVVTTIASGMGTLTSLAIGPMDTFYTYNYGTGIIYKIAPGGTVSTLTTLPNGGIDLDYVSPDTMYLAGYGNNVIYQIDHTGAYTVLAGDGSFGSSDGSGTAASFSNPSGIVRDGAGNLFVADLNSNLIREVTPAGVVSTFAGDGTPASTDGTGTGASFNAPWAITLSRTTGNLFVAESGSGDIRSITGATPTALPLDWLSYSATLSPKLNACIQWKVQETNVSNYQLLKSTNGQNFEPMATIAGKGNGEHNYTYTEPQALMGRAYYRIRQADYSGAFTYSSTMILEGGKNGQTAMKVYPTVFNEEFTVSVDQTQSATLIDAKGQIVKVLELIAGNNTINARDLSSGNYYYLKTAHDVQMIVKQ